MERKEVRMVSGVSVGLIVEARGMGSAVEVDGW